jgi:hypothetical protein
MDGCFECSIPLYKSASFNYRLNVPKKVPNDPYPLDGIKKGERVGGIHLQACPSTNNN